MKEQTKKWVEAAKILMEDTHRKVQCPECKNGCIIVKDEVIPDRYRMIDRYLICESCCKWNVMTIELPI